MASELEKMAPARCMAFGPMPDSQQMQSGQDVDDSDSLSLSACLGRP